MKLGEAAAARPLHPNHVDVTTGQLGGRPVRTLQSAAVLSVLTAGFALCLGVATCEAADHSYRSIDSGRPSDLINQPTCWPVEQSDDLRHCDVARNL